MTVSLFSLFRHSHSPDCYPHIMSLSLSFSLSNTHSLSLTHSLRSGLEEQLLGVVVAEELPELSEQKANLVVQNAQMSKQLYDIESEILYLLSNSTGTCQLRLILLISPLTFTVPFFDFFFDFLRRSYATSLQFC